MFFEKFKKEHMIIAHRGDRSKRAENTMSAFESSIGKADMIELDINFTKDGIPVIIHDNTLNRTSNVKKIKHFKAPYKVNDYTYKELLELDFSSWFLETDPFGTIKKYNLYNELKSIPPQKIPTLSEVLEFSKINKIPLNIEIKDLSNTPFDLLAVKKIVNLIKDYEMDEFVIISSFKHSYLKEVKKISDIPTAALEENKIFSNITNYLKELKVSVYHIYLPLVKKEIVKTLLNNGIYTNVFTVNSKKIKEILFEIGVKGIFTDYLENMPE